jgi:hypothetical protein
VAADVRAGRRRGDGRDGTAALAVRKAQGVQGAAIIVDTAYPVPAVPASFLGFSLEVPAAAAYAGTAGMRLAGPV